MSSTICWTSRGGAGVKALTVKATAKLMIMPTKPMPSGVIPKRYCSLCPPRNWK